MFNKPLDQLTKEDIQRLVSDGVPESRSLDYKAELPKFNDTGKKEFVADIISFANAVGGYLIFGVTEAKDAEGKNTGKPDAATGIDGANLDDLMRKVESIIRTSIDPKLPHFHWKDVHGFEKGPVLVVHIPKSWAAPHMLTTGESRFYSRSSVGKYGMDVRQIRSAFLLSAEMPTLIRRFRDERLGRILAGETPVSLWEGLKVVMHLVPFSSMDADANVDLGSWEQLNLRTPTPDGAGLGDPAYNFDGFMIYYGRVDGPYRSYTQVFRTGAIEATYAYGAYGDTKYVHPWLLEVVIVDSVKSYLSAYKKQAVDVPIVVAISLLDARGSTLPPTRRHLEVTKFVNMRGELLLPNILVREHDVDVPQLLKPAFDTLWQAHGLARSFCYDDDGSWTGRNFDWESPASNRR